jgi:hypothetical protein
MACIDYMKNFYFDMYFKTDTYQSLLKDVLTMSNTMIMKTYQKNSEVLNEVLELYRIIVEK